MRIDYGTIGRRIKTVREMAGLSQKELGKRIGRSTTAISLFESGERKISLELLGKIAKELQVSFKELLEGYSSLPQYASLKHLRKNEPLLISFRITKGDAEDQKLIKAIEETLQKIRQNERK